jgi:hypothetical protein
MINTGVDERFDEIINTGVDERSDRGLMKGIIQGVDERNKLSEIYASGYPSKQEMSHIMRNESHNEK